jgi:sec-independent protein translocase protein TatC
VDVSEERRIDLIGHLSELRSRIIRIIVYVACGMVVVWIFFDHFYRALTYPIRMGLGQLGGELIVYELMEGLLVKTAIALVGGVILAGPFLLYEVWSFIAPGLTGTERRAARPLIPVAMLLFLMGVGVGYMVSAPAVRMLLRFVPPETEIRLSLSRSVLTLVKFYLAFGLCFQLPIVIVLLAKIGIVDSGMLVRRWREAAVGILVLAAVVTPTWDPITLSIAALPMMVLYIGTIGAVKIIERRERKRRESEDLPTE